MFHDWVMCTQVIPSSTQMQDSNSLQALKPNAGRCLLCTGPAQQHIRLPSLLHQRRIQAGQRITLDSVQSVPHLSSAMELVSE